MNRQMDKEAFNAADPEIGGEPKPKEGNRPVWSPQSSEFLDDFHKGDHGDQSESGGDSVEDGGAGDREDSLEDRVVAALRNIYDPEIPVNIYDLGLIYAVEATEDGEVVVTMTLTTPHCPVAETMPGEVEARVAAVEGVSEATVNLVWDPPWDMSKMTDEARLELGLL